MVEEHPVTDLKPFHLRRDLVHDADGLVAQDDGHLLADVPVHGVAGADAADRDLHADVAGLQGWQRQLLYPHIVQRVGAGRAHGGPVGGAHGRMAIFRASRRRTRSSAAGSSSKETRSVIKGSRARVPRQISSQARRTLSDV